MVTFKTIHLAKITFLVLFVFCLESAVALAVDARVVVLQSHDSKPYEEALEGFQQVLSEQGLKIHLNVFSLNGDQAKAVQGLEAAKKEGANLLFTIGSFATETAIKEKIAIPVVASLVLSEDILKKPNITGVGLEFPLEIQFEWLQRFLPYCRNIGILYNPKENQQTIEAARGWAEKMGAKLYAQEVHTPQELPVALDSLANKADVLLGISDKVVLTSQTSKNILLFSFRNKIPFVGLSTAWVKAGALYCLERDYKDIGIQCGEMAFKVLQGTPAHSIRQTIPRKVMYCLNLKTARHMKLEIADKDVQNAFIVFN